MAAAGRRVRAGIFFLPIFFTFTGLRTNLLGLTGDLDWLGIVLAASILGKIVPVFIAARASGFTTDESITLGALMNTRALTDLIVLNVGYDPSFLPPSIFAMLVLDGGRDDSDDRAVAAMAATAPRASGRGGYRGLASDGRTANLEPERQWPAQPSAPLDR